MPTKFQKAQSINNTVSNTTSLLGILGVAVPGISEVLFFLSGISMAVGGVMSILQASKEKEKEKRALGMTEGALQEGMALGLEGVPFASILRNSYEERKFFVTVPGVRVQATRMANRIFALSNVAQVGVSLYDAIDLTKAKNKTKWETFDTVNAYLGVANALALNYSTFRFVQESSQNQQIQRHDFVQNHFADTEGQLFKNQRKTSLLVGLDRRAGHDFNDRYDILWPTRNNGYYNQGWKERIQQWRTPMMPTPPMPTFKSTFLTRFGFFQTPEERLLAHLNGLPDENVSLSNSSYDSNTLRGLQQQKDQWRIQSRPEGWDPRENPEGRGSFRESIHSIEGEGGGANSRDSPHTTP